MFSLIKEILSIIVSSPIVCAKLAKLYLDMSDHIAQLKSQNTEQKTNASVAIALKILEFVRKNPDDTKTTIKELENLLRRYNTDSAFKQTIISLINKSNPKK